jgi:hypothetical protein
MREILDYVSRPSWLVRTHGAPVAAKRRLQARGYRWNVADRRGMREVRDDEVDAELGWLDEEVYSPGPEPERLATLL